jgi:hypothetical protein
VNDRAMAKADLRQIFAEKCEEKGRMPQDTAGKEVKVEREEGEVTWWNVLEQGQTGATGVLVEEGVAGVRSQCFFVKIGISRKAQYRWSFIRALVIVSPKFT